MKSGVVRADKAETVRQVSISWMNYMEHIIICDLHFLKFVLTVLGPMGIPNVCTYIEGNENNSHLLSDTEKIKLIHLNP